MATEVPILKTMEITRRNSEFRIESTGLTNFSYNQLGINYFQNKEGIVELTVKMTKSWVLSHTILTLSDSDKKIDYNLSPKELPMGFSLGTKEDFRFISLRNQFNEELKGLTEEFASAEEAFKLMSDELKKINFKESVVEITPSSTLKFTLLLDDSRMLMVSRTIEKFDDQPDECVVVFSFFINRKLVFSDAIEIKAFVKGFNEYLTV